MYKHEVSNLWGHFRTGAPHPLLNSDGCGRTRRTRTSCAPVTQDCLFWIIVVFSNFSSAQHCSALLRAFMALYLKNSCPAAYDWTVGSVLFHHLSYEFFCSWGLLLIHVIFFRSSVGILVHGVFVFSDLLFMIQILTKTFGFSKHNMALQLRI